MADASDSKSDVGDYVWVQVPSPALVEKSREPKILLKSRVSGFCRVGHFYLFALQKCNIKV